MSRRRRRGYSAGLGSTEADQPQPDPGSTKPVELCRPGRHLVRPRAPGLRLLVSLPRCRQGLRVCMGSRTPSFALRSDALPFELSWLAHPLGRALTTGPRAFDPRNAIRPMPFALLLASGWPRGPFETPSRLVGDPGRTDSSPAGPTFQPSPLDLPGALGCNPRTFPIPTPARRSAPDPVQT